MTQLSLQGDWWYFDEVDEFAFDISFITIIADNNGNWKIMNKIIFKEKTAKYIYEWTLISQRQKAIFLSNRNKTPLIL